MKRSFPVSTGAWARYWLPLWLCLVSMAFPVTAVMVVDNQIADIEFRRDKQNRGVLSVKLAKPQSLVDMRKSGRQLYIEMVGTTLSDEMVYLLDVADFATAVESVETLRTEKGARLVLNTTADFVYDYDLKGALLTVFVAGRPEQATAGQSRDVSYSGKPISINFQDILVRNVLQLIAEYNDFNLVVSDSVQGSVTLRLDDVPWPQVLEIILQAKGLDKRVQGSVVLIAPKQELTLSEQQVLEARRKEQELASLRSEIIQVNFAKATDLAELLQGGDGGSSMLSNRGSLHVDDRTNSLIVNDLGERIDTIKNIIAALDIPVKQVHIEARIVSVNEGDIDEIGVRWGVLSSSGSKTVGGSIESNLNSVGLLEEEATVEDFLNVNLAATQAGASSIAFQVAKMGDILLDLELSALQSENKLEIISSPRLVTTNKQMAYIEQGTEIPYLEASSSGGGICWL